MICANSNNAQNIKHDVYYDRRVSLFNVLPKSHDDIIFLGNSITNGGEWAELFQNIHVKNRGITSDVCQGVYDRLNSILQGKPAKIFLLIGINDVSHGATTDTIVQQIEIITEKIKKDSPFTRLYIQSILPITNCFNNSFNNTTKRWEQIPLINKELEKMAKKEKVTYIDLFSHFADKDNKMKKEYTNDGIHILGNGYIEWVKILKPYIDSNK